MSATNTKPIIGLVGGMGSGKSRVAAELARYGGRLISGDAIGHEALRQPELREKVVQRWGTDVLQSDGEIDRRKVAAIVFASTDERRALEEMLHPWIEQRIREQIQEAKADPACRFVILDAAVMLEAGWEGVCDRLVYVEAPREVRLRRLAEQRGWSTKDVVARENAQLSLTEKASRAHDAVDNSGSLAQLTPQVEALLRKWGLRE
jgi:dephospho-CoA kinase